MNINPETKPVSEIFSIESKVIYKIPFYQRNYSWNNQNIEDLFNDIMNETKGYYIGNLLVSKNKKEDGITVLDVVDGQQRLTTMALFFLAIYEKVGLFLPDVFDNEGKILMKNINLLQHDLSRKLIFEDTGKPKLELLDKDAEVYNNFLGILQDKEKSKFGNRAFVKRYNYILDQLLFDLDNLEKITNFYDKLNSVEILRITVDDLTDAFTVFSSLNAKGLPLTLIDLLKSNYLSVAISEITQEKAMSQWNKLIDIFCDSNKNPNSAIITQFLLNNYDTFINENTLSITKSSALRKYEAVFNEKKYKYMDELIENAKLYSYISAGIENSEEIEIDPVIEKYLMQLNKLESSQVYPLVLFLFKHHKHGKLETNKFIEVLQYLIKYYVRRNVVLKPKSSNIRFKVMETIRALEKVKSINDEALKLTTENLNKIISSDDDFYNALNGSIYDISPNTVRFILIDLERTFGNYFNKQNLDNLDDYSEKKKGKKVLIWTLEHILPQNENLKTEWQNMISPDDIDLANQLQKNHMHRLGNLTLTGYNSELSDKEFAIKKDYQPEGSNAYTGLRTGLFLNTSIPDQSINESIEEKNSWTIEDINRRTEILAKLAFEKYKIEKQ